MIAGRSHEPVAHAPHEEGGQERGQLAMLVGLIALAMVLRFWRLGDWNFQATEMFTLRDSLSPKLTNARPLGYLLNHYLVGSFRPLDEFGLRLLPAIFGVLAVPALYMIAKRLAGPRAALCSAALLVASPLHIMYSQLARYWSLVFLLSAIYPYAIYLGLRERDRRWLVVGAVSAVLAVLAHPVSILPMGGLVLYLGPSLRREHLTQLWSQRAVRWASVLVLVLGVVILVRLVPMLQGWISMHDRNPGYGQFLRPPMPAPGFKQVIYLSIFAESLTVPLVLSAIAGAYWLWQGGDRSLGRFLTSLAVVHIGFLTLLSLRTSVSQYYLLPSAPVFFLGAAIFVAQLFRVTTPWRERWLLPGMMITVTIAAGAPTLISDARDGRRYDFRTSARWIANHLEPADIVFSDQPGVMAHYLPQHPVRHLLHDVDALKAAMSELQRDESGGRLWIVAPAASHAYRPNLKQGGMGSWIYEHCQLRNSVGVGRVDFRQNYLHIFRCPSTDGLSDPADE